MSACITHGAEGMPRAKRRRIERLAAEVDRVIETDRRFFDRRPDRSYRVRTASGAEIQQAAEIGQSFGELPGYRYYVAVRQFSPGVRARAYFAGPVGNDTDVPEWQARWLYEREVRLSPSVAYGNAQMEAVAARVGGAAL